MKRNGCWRGRHDYLYGFMLALVALCFAACKDKDVQEEEAFDPSKPIVITDFMPKEGGFGSNLILYGDNFGNDPKKLKVTVGGEQANIVAVKNKILYCVIPQKAEEGDIQINVCNDRGEEIAYAEAEGTFKYLKSWLVSTLVGTRFENDNDAIEVEGPFDECGRVSKPFWLSFDPKSDFDLLYLTAHDAGFCRLLNMKEETVSFLTQFSKTDRPAIINWTADENKDMVVSRDLPNDGNVNVLYSRSSDFKTQTPLTDGVKKHKSLTGAMVHPKNGEIYFATYYDQDIFRYDIETKQFSSSSKHLKTKETTRMVVHPEGKFAYMMLYYYSGKGGGYIARMDYDGIAKRFTEPYIVAGTTGSTGYADGVGNKARMNGPAQGVFVKNTAYEGEEDEYDFYFCDEKNNCIRILTPNARVVTFAGRGNDIPDAGYADGDLRGEARFSNPVSIAYDEKRKCFYVGDTGNRLIRKIAQEE